MNKWYFACSAAILFGSLTAGAQTPTETTSPSTKIIVIEEKVDRDGNKTISKTIREGNFSDEEIDQIIEQESNIQTDTDVRVEAGASSRERAFLGVMMENADTGVRITEIVAGSPAESAGLQAGDVIMAVGPTEVHDIVAVVNAVGAQSPGTAVDIRYVRDGNETSKSVVLGKREEPVVSDAFKWDEDVQRSKDRGGIPAEEFKKSKSLDDVMKMHEKIIKEEEKADSKPRFGVSIDETTSGMGVVVTRVYEGSLAEEAGLEKGDVITKFNKIEVSSPDDLIDAVNESPADKNVKVEFLRDGKKMKEKVTFERS